MVRDITHNFPRDVRAVFVLVGVVSVSLFLPPVTSLPIQLVFELPLAVFLPGYAVVAALFPRSSGCRSQNDPRRVLPNRISVVERIGLSFGLSVAVVSLIGLALNLSPWGLRRLPIIVGINSFVVVTAGIATVRRLNVPKDERFTIDPSRYLRRTYSRYFGGNTRLDMGLNILLIVSVIIVVSSVAFVFSVPTEGERSTGFQMLSESEDNELIAGDYPTTFDEGETRPVTLQIRNEEYEQMDYTVVVKLQRVRVTDGSTAVVEERELNRLRAAGIEHNTTWTQQYGIEPTITGERLRVVFLLYRGSAPEEAVIDDAYRGLRLQVNVTE